MNREELVAEAKKKFEREQLVSAAKEKFAAESSIKKPEPALDETVAAAAEGAGDILSFGYAPQIKAGLSKAVGAVTPFSPQQVLATFDKPIGDVISGKAYEGLPEEDLDYVALRDMASKQSEKVKAADPTGYLLGSGVGVASTMGLGGARGVATAAQKGIVPLAKSLTGAGLKGSVSSAVYNPGDVEGVVDPLQLKERAENAKVGAAFGVAGQVLPKVAGYVAPKLKETANAIAAKALGRSTKGFKERLGKKGLQEMGEMALDKGVVGVIPKTIDGLNNKIETVRKSVGAQIGKVIDDTVEVEQKLAQQGAKVGVDKEAIAAKIRSELLDPDTFPSPEYVQKVEKRIQSFLNTGEDAAVLPTKGAHTIKTKLGQDMERKGVWKRLKMGTASEDDILNASFYDTLGDAVVDSASATATLAGSSADDILKLNKEYSTLKNMQKIAKDEMARVDTNNLLSLTSIIGGAAAGVGTEDPLKGLAVAGAIRAGSRIGPQMAAKGFQAASKLAGGLSRAPVVGPVAAGQLAGMSQSQFVSRAAGSQFQTPTKGAKVLNLENYDNSEDLVDLTASPEVIDQVMKSDLTNSEKARVIVKLQKEGKISRTVLEYLGGK